jgi:hypothetical protein
VPQSLSSMLFLENASIPAISDQLIARYGGCFLRSKWTCGCGCHGPNPLILSSLDFHGIILSSLLPVLLMPCL